MYSASEEPKGQLTIRTLAMPADANPDGDIFGGLVVSQMDLAGASLASNVAKTRVVTASIESMSFISPVKVGDFVCCYAELLKIGTTSVRMRIQAWVLRKHSDKRHQVTEGIFTFVAIREARNIVARNTGITYSLDKR